MGQIYLQDIERAKAAFECFSENEALMTEYQAAKDSFMKGEMPLIEFARKLDDLAERFIIDKADQMIARDAG